MQQRLAQVQGINENKANETMGKPRKIYLYYVKKDRRTFDNRYAWENSPGFLNEW